MKLILAACLAIGVLSGCAVYTPGAVVVDRPAYPSSGGGGFCPPGQAKKGNC